MGQMLVEGGHPDANIRRAEEMISKAAREHCDIVVLPECLDLGWTYGDARAQAEPIPGKYADRLIAAAVDCRIPVIAGLTERDHDKIFNAAILISAEGTILAKHCKINELAIGHEIYDLGHSLSVTDTALGAIGLNICADNFPRSQSLGRALGQMGSELLLSPCAWAVDANHDNDAQPYGDLWLESYSKLALEFEMPVIGVSCVGPITSGPWAGRKCCGMSLAMGAGGEVIARGPYDQQALVVVEVTPHNSGRAERR